MTNPALQDKIRELLANATPGPWEIKTSGCIWSDVSWGWVLFTSGDDIPSDADTELFTQAPALLTEAADEIDALQAKLEARDKVIDELERMKGRNLMILPKRLDEALAELKEKRE